MIEVRGTLHVKLPEQVLRNARTVETSSGVVKVQTVIGDRWKKVAEVMSVAIDAKVCK